MIPRRCALGPRLDAGRLAHARAHHLPQGPPAAHGCRPRPRGFFSATWRTIRPTYRSFRGSLSEPTASSSWRARRRVRPSPGAARRRAGLRGVGSSRPAAWRPATSLSPAATRPSPGCCRRCSSWPWRPASGRGPRQPRARRAHGWNTRQIWRLYRSNWQGMAGLVIMAVFVAMALLAPFLADHALLDPTPRSGGPPSAPPPTHPLLPWFGMDRTGHVGARRSSSGAPASRSPSAFRPPSSRRSWARASASPPATTAAGAARSACASPTSFWSSPGCPWPWCWPPPGAQHYWHHRAHHRHHELARHRSRRARRRPARARAAVHRARPGHRLGNWHIMQKHVLPNVFPWSSPT